MKAGNQGPVALSAAAVLATARGLVGMGCFPLTDHHSRVSVCTMPSCVAFPLQTGPGGQRGAGTSSESHGYRVAESKALGAQGLKPRVPWNCVVCKSQILGWPEKPESEDMGTHGWAQA